MRLLLRSSAGVLEIVCPTDALERHDFDKRSVVGMTEKRKLKVTVSTLDRFHDESEYRLRIPARYIVDSEGVTPGREVNADYTRLAESRRTVLRLYTYKRMETKIDLVTVRFQHFPVTSLNLGR